MFITQCILNIMAKELSFYVYKTIIPNHVLCFSIIKTVFEGFHYNFHLQVLHLVWEARVYFMGVLTYDHCVQHIPAFNQGGSWHKLATDLVSCLAYNVDNCVSLVWDVQSCI